MSFVPKAENPFFRAPHSPFYLSEPFDPGASRADLLCQLKSRLAQLDALCFDKEATLRPGEIWWPRKAWLNEFSKIIRRFSSLHRRGRKELWSCIKALDNRYSELKLGGKIERL